MSGSQYSPNGQQHQNLQKTQNLSSSVGALRSLKRRCVICPDLMPKWIQNAVVMAVGTWGMEKLCAYGNMGSLNMGNENSHYNDEINWYVCNASVEFKCPHKVMNCTLELFTMFLWL